MGCDGVLHNCRLLPGSFIIIIVITNTRDDIFSAIIHGAKTYARVHFGSSE